MNSVEPIRDFEKIQAIKKMLWKEKNPRNYLIFVAGINFALRIGDLLKLRVSDIQDEKGEIREFFYIREEKTNKERKIIINESVREALKHFFDKSGIFKEESYLFTSKRERINRPISRVMAWNLIKLWCKKVGIKERIGTHTLRKTFGYQARTRGNVAIEKIQGILGHRSVIVTNRYIGVEGRELEKVSKEFCL